MNQGLPQEPTRLAVTPCGSDKGLVLLNWLQSHFNLPDACKGISRQAMGNRWP